VEFGVKLKTAEGVDLSERFENRSPQFIFEVNFTMDPIIELQPDDMVVDVACLDNARKHRVTPMRRWTSRAFTL
jgi:hypothetical protein